MVSVVKSEWHQVEKRYGIEIDADMLTEIYPDKEEEEIESPTPKKYWIKK